jgi:hypothetical protein
MHTELTADYDTDCWLHAGLFDRLRTMTAEMQNTHTRLTADPDALYQHTVCCLPAGAVRPAAPL